MTSFLNTYFQNFDAQWEEIDLLLSEAKANNSENVSSAITRACLVLMSAHLEAFLKEVGKNIISDINAYGNFDYLPNLMKSRYCDYFMPKSLKDGTEKIAIEKKLVKTFSEHKNKIETEAFEISTQNPKPATINKYIEHFGVRNFCNLLDGSQLDLAFGGDNTELENLLTKMKKHILKHTNNYPYGVSIKYFRIKEGSNKESLWVNFLDELVRRRNNIAHGLELENITFAEIMDFRKKIEIIQYAIAIVETFHV